MSVYKPKKSQFWQFDFVIRGQRFHGSTGQLTKRAAQGAERRLRTEAAEGRLGETSALTIDQAAGRWWAEVGIHRADASDVERRVTQLVAIMGLKTVIANITASVVSAAIQERRAMPYQRGDAASTKRYPANATVNRDIIETLRPILRRAVSHWGATGLPAIAWRDLKLKEPSGQVKSYSPTEQAAWLAECGPATALALRLLLVYGLRYGELFFELDAFDPDGPRLKITKRKRDVPHSLPLRDDDARQIASRVGIAKAAGLAHIWFAPDGTGKLESLTYDGMKARLHGAADRAKIPKGRRIHGTRHHAGTTALRKSKSLKVTQALLGHADIKSTMRYAHLLEDDLRSILDELPRNSPEAESSRVEKVRRRKG